MNMREGFREIVSGWTLISGMEDITDRIERAAEWTKVNGPLLPDEQATIEIMIKAQIARGMPDIIRACGLEREYGLRREQCPTCGEEVDSIFDHLDRDCEHD